MVFGPALALTVTALLVGAPSAADEGNPVVKPNPQQVKWQDMEIGMMICFDIPVYTDVAEWDWQKTGHLDPALYNPVDLDTDQWLDAAKAAGARYTVLVAKHCSGFMCWQSDLYPYGVKQSPWRGGKGDVVRDYVDSCRRAGVQPGLYASVTANAYWDVSNPGLVNWGAGGDAAKQSEYARVAEKMLAELWGNYGSFFEVWFDGGALSPDQGGPDILPILRRLQPEAIVFGGPASSIRWIGNESGVAAYPCWATVSAHEAAGAGDPDGLVWQPGECDVPIRNHDWFWHPDSERKLYSVGELVDMYYRSVGRNCNLLLNANIDRRGLVPEADMQRYREFAAEIERRFGHSLAETEGRGSVVELQLARPTLIDHVIAMEDIREGERVREYAIECRIRGEWCDLCTGQSIGHKRIDRFEPVKVTGVRLRCVRPTAEPIIRKLAVYYVGGAPQG